LAIIYFRILEMRRSTLFVKQYAVPSFRPPQLAECAQQPLSVAAPPIIGDRVRHRRAFARATGFVPARFRVRQSRLRRPNGHSRGGEGRGRSFAPCPREMRGGRENARRLQCSRRITGSRAGCHSLPGSQSDRPCLGVDHSCRHRRHRDRTKCVDCGDLALGYSRKDRAGLCR